MKKTRNQQKKRNRRLQILNHEEVVALYTVPQFNATERSHYFLLPEEVLNSLRIQRKNSRDVSSKLWFILQFGYFRARHQFFRISYGNVRDDVAFIMSQYLPNDRTPHQLPSRRIQAAVKIRVLQWMKYRNDTGTALRLAAKKAAHLAMKTSRLTEIFTETIRHLDNKKRVLPAYSQLQDVIGMVLKTEEKRLSDATERNMTKDTMESLQNLFVRKDGIYRITELKIDAKSFQTKEMKDELTKLVLCRPIYLFARKFLPSLGISRSMIEYYADYAKLYRVFRIKRIPRPLAWFYLICYVYGRYEKLASNIISGFIYYVDCYNRDAKNYTKNHMDTLSGPLTEHNKSIGKLMSILADKKTASQTGKKITDRAFKIMPQKNIAAVSKKLLNIEEYRKEQALRLTWEYHRKNYQSILINLRPLSMEIDFEGADRKMKDLLVAIRFIKNAIINGMPVKEMPIHKIPRKHIKPKALLALFTDIGKKSRATAKPLNQWQYEFYLYRTIREKFRTGKMYVNSSASHKSFAAEVNIDPDWNSKKSSILKELNNPVLLRPIEKTLAELENTLENLIDRANRNAMNGENKHITIIHHRDGRTEWKLPYPKRNTEMNHPIYNSIEMRTISEVFDFVEQKYHFMRAFKPHAQRSITKLIKDFLGIKGVILANGTMQGTNLFSKRSNLHYQRLQTAEQNYIRLATLREAADILVDCMINFPIFDLYELGGKKHGSVDGTKKKTRRRILKARHSTKYFGTDIGIVVMNMTLGHIPFVTRVTGANEHESHYVWPMLYSNTSEIDPDIISTDTAGTNNINDLMYYVLGKTHAPFYRSTARKAEGICGFKPLSHYENLLIQPGYQTKTALIIEKWPEIQSVLASILLHDSKQENIIRILSSHDFKSDLKDAIWELNNIQKSIHILKFIDDPDYRRNIRTSLNRGEAYNLLLKMVMDVGGGDFRGRSELEVEIWNECTRIITLVIICYNMHILSKLYEDAIRRNDQAAIELLRHISPVASQHINIGGLYEFSETLSTINVDSIVDMLGKILADTINTSDGS
jgi:TnpA family transposase